MSVACLNAGTFAMTGDYKVCRGSSQVCCLIFHSETTPQHAPHNDTKSRITSRLSLLVPYPVPADPTSSLHIIASGERLATSPRPYSARQGRVKLNCLVMSQKEKRPRAHWRRSVCHTCVTISSGLIMLYGIGCSVDRALSLLRKLYCTWHGC